MNKVHKTPIQCQWEKIHTENYMYIQHAPTEITKKSHLCQYSSLDKHTECWHRHTQTSHKVKTVFQYARGHIYSGRCCQDKTKKHANKYTGKIPDVQINIVQQRIPKTKNYGGKGKGGGGRERRRKKKGEKKRSVFLVKSLVWQRKN